MRGQRRHDASEGLLVSGALILPLVAAVTFAIWMVVWRQPLDGPHFLLGLLGCVAAGEIASGEPLASIEHLGSPRQLLIGILWRWSLVMVIAWTGVELAGLSSSLNWNVIASAALTLPLLLWSAQLAIAHVILGRVRANTQTKSIVVGLTEIGSRWESSVLRNPALGISIVAYFDDREASRLQLAHYAKIAGRLADVAAFVNSHQITVVYITLPMSRQRRIVEFIDSLRNSTVSIYFVPDVYAFDPVQARIECIHGIPLVAICDSPFRGASAFAKRAMDVAISLAALAIFAGPMLLIALLIRFTSPGPAIFRQNRYGLDGENIVVFKFRTMTVTEDGERNYTQVFRGDSRVTMIGALLRATSMDELPQLLNVLVGTMSVVGPRPHAIAVNEQYRELIPRYMLRHKVKPGITGLAQIRGYRGGDDLASMTKRIESDLAYLRGWSLGLDLKIMARTAMLVWSDRNAF
jgi:putative colanic acid biosynthesis UDP-glucose lipid carrier transferase